MASDGQQHPLGIYFWIWGLLFVISFFSYMVDYLQFHGMLRWSLIIIFMFLKAGFIVAINRDPGAAIFQISDVCIVEDLKMFIPVLIDRLAAFRKATSSHE